MTAPTSRLADTIRPLTTAHPGVSGLVALDEGGKLSVSRLARQLGDASGLIALNVTRVFLEVTHRMAIDGREILEEAYREGAR